MLLGPPVSRDDSKHTENGSRKPRNVGSVLASFGLVLPVATWFD